MKPIPGWRNQADFCHREKQFPMAVIMGRSVW